MLGKKHKTVRRLLLLGLALVSMYAVYCTLYSKSVDLSGYEVEVYCATGAEHFTVTLSPSEVEKLSAALRGMRLRFGDIGHEDFSHWIIARREDEEKYYTVYRERNAIYLGEWEVAHTQAMLGNSIFYYHPRKDLTALLDEICHEKERLSE